MAAGRQDGDSVDQSHAEIHREFDRLYEQVIKAKEDWQNTVDSIPDMICILDREARILRVNRSFSTRLNKPYDELIGVRCSEIIHASQLPPPNCPFQTVINAGHAMQREQDIEIEDSLFSASLYPFHDAAGELRGAVHIFHDITDQKRLKDQLIQAEKMAAVGALATEIAHEINNPLDYINNYLYLLSESLPADFKSKEYIDKIQKGIDNLALLTRDLLEFSRPPSDVLTAVNVHHIIDTSLEFTAGQINDSHVQVTKRYGCRGGLTIGSERMLRQVFLNLIRNALDALMPGGRISITTSCDDERFIIEFTDGGTGIAAQNISRIFEPFFTTKKAVNKRGTGLGLTICYNIIKHHGGSIAVSSKEGQGTTFTIMLPAAR